MRRFLRQLSLLLPLCALSVVARAWLQLQLQGRAYLRFP